MNNNQSIDRIFSVVETIAESGEMGITEIAKAIDLPKSTTHRIVNSLAEKNYLQKADNNRYKLGYKFIAIAGDYVSTLDIRTLAMPFIHKLSKNLNVTAHLALLQGDMAVYIEKVQPYSNLCMYSEIGRAIDLYCSALGKALLLGFSQNELKNYIDGITIIQHTEQTLSKQKLAQEIETARKTLVTLDNAEHEEGIFCIATPVFDYSGKVIAAISIATTTKNILYEEKYRKELKEATKKLSAMFGKLI